MAHPSNGWGLVVVLMVVVVIVLSSLAWEAEASRRGWRSRGRRLGDRRRAGGHGRVMAMAWPRGRYTGHRRPQLDQPQHKSSGHHEKNGHHQKSGHHLGGHHRSGHRLYGGSAGNSGWTRLGGGRMLRSRYPLSAFLRLGGGNGMGMGMGAHAFPLLALPYQLHHPHNQRHPWRVNFGLGYGRQPNWWEGPNVCRSVKKGNKTEGEGDGEGEREGEGEGQAVIAHHFTTSTTVCEGSDTAYKCTTTTQNAEGEVTEVELYECCHGYTRKEEDHGCPQEQKLSDLPSTARSLGLGEMMSALRAVGMEEDLTVTNFTIFAPKAFPFQGQSEVAPARRRVRRDVIKYGREPYQLPENGEEDRLRLEEMVLSHVVPDTRRMTSLRDEVILQTGSPQDSTIRVNFYSRPRKLTTANCVKVTSADNLATNGVIHVVEKVLPSVTSSLVDLVRGDKQFSYLKTALSRADMVPTLQGDGQFTLLAPTDHAFRRLDRAILDKFMTPGNQCLTKLVKHHVLPNVICSGVMQGKAKSLNLLKGYVNLTRTDDDKLFANDAQVVRVDVMATNGVMHVIDDVLIPDEALDVLSVAKKNGLSEFVRLTEMAGLTSLLHNVSDVTVFAPSNEAIQALSPAVQKRLSSDKGLAQDLVKYHVVPREMTCRRMYAGRVLDTLNPKAKVNVNQYSPFSFGGESVTTVQCAPVRSRNIQACGGLLHVIDRVLVPPSGNLVDVLAQDAVYTTFVRLMKTAGLADLLQDQPSLTVLAPTNKAFQQLGEEKLKKLEENHEELAKLLKLHIIQGHLCCSGIFQSNWWNPQRVRAIGGDAVTLSRDRNGQPLVNDAVIGSCDNTATNGLVHGLESVLTNQKRRNPWSAYYRY